MTKQGKAEFEDLAREEAHLLAQHLRLLRKRRSQHELLEVTTTPIFTMSVSILPLGEPFKSL